MASEDELLAALRRHWDLSGADEDVADDIYAVDVLLEFPQSGERYVGVEHLRAWLKGYPATLRVDVRQLTLHEDHAVAELHLTVHGKPWMTTVSMLELEDDVIRHERIYVLDGGEPADFREPRRTLPDAE